jgi:hypothetical protein
MAIHFALTGQGKKLVQYGRKSCSVEYDTPRLNIVRTKGPCRLLVTTRDGGGVANGVATTYEDNEAQGIIDTVFKNWEIGYVDQRCTKSFILMTPSDKLQYIERIALGDAKIDVIRSRCNELVIGRQKRLLGVKCKREAEERVLDTFDEKDKLDSIDLSSFDETQARETIRKMELSISFEDRRRQLIKELETDCDCACDAFKLDDTEDRLAEAIIKTTKWKRYRDACSRLETFDIELSPTAREKKIRELDDIEPMKRARAQLDSISDTEQTLDRYRKELNELLAKPGFIRYECPLCSGAIRLKNNELVTISNATSTDEPEIPKNLLFERNKQIAELEQKINEIAWVSEKRREIETRYPSLPSSAYLYERSLALCVLKRSADERTRLVGEAEALRCEEPDSNDTDVEALAKRVARKSLRDAKLEELRSIENGDHSRVIVPTRDEVEAMRHKCDTARDAKKYSACRDRARQYAAEEDERTSETVRAESLARLIKSSEKLAMTAAIEAMNETAKKYIDRFFQEDDLSVRLNYDTDKIAVDITLNEYDTDLSCLSGGELARVTLAFAIALAELYDVDTLMLDETLASLDENNTFSVLEAIRELYEGRVICVAHQTVKGLFDSVIEL